MNVCEAGSHEGTTMRTVFVTSRTYSPSPPLPISGAPDFPRTCHVPQVAKLGMDALGPGLGRALLALPAVRNRTIAKSEIMPMGYVLVASKQTIDVNRPP